jgi:hypothetical protein
MDGLMTGATPGRVGAATVTPEQVRAAMVTPQFATQARGQVTAGQLATWAPALPRDTRLLTPVDVQALVVTPSQGQQAVPTQTVIPLSKPGDPADQVLPVPPTPFGTPVARPPGVHLHWAMPDGLTKGDAGAARADPVPAGNPTGLPPLPDRWVVVRLVHGTASVRSFVLLADRGEHHDLAGWTDPGPPAAGQATGASGQRVIAPDKLTAVAGGDHAWAATYDAVLDRFAFYDDLSDVGGAGDASTVLSYLVAGWWSAPANDPLTGCESAGDYQRRCAWLGWLAPEPDGLTDATTSQTALRSSRETIGLTSPVLNTGGRMATALTPGAGAEITTIQPELLDPGAGLLTGAGPAVPQQTLLHGSVMGIALAAGQPDLRPGAEALAAAVGPSSFGALSALLAEGGTESQRVSSERLLAAFAGGLLPVIDQPGGLADVDSDRHAAGFTGSGGGSRDQPDRVGEGDIMAGNRTAPVPETRSAEPFAGSAAQREQVAVRSLLIPRTTAEVAGVSLVNRFGAGGIGTPPSPAPRSYRDVPVPLPRFFQPADLAVMIRGAVRSLRHGGDGLFTPSGQLACRLASQVVHGIAGLLDGGQLPAGLQSVGNGSVPNEVDLLLQELVLTDPYRWQEQTGWITAVRSLPAEAVSNRLRAELALRYAFPAGAGGEAAAATAPAGTAALAAVIPVVPDLAASAADTLRRASLWEGTDVSPVGVTRWAQPWVPLWCDWEVQAAVADDLDEWALGPIDLEAVQTPGAAPAPQVIRGRTALVSAAARALAGRINQWLADEASRQASGQGEIGSLDQAALAAAAGAAAGTDVLAGAFHGIRETLLGLDPVDAARASIDPAGHPTSKPAAKAAPLLLAGGAVTVTRLRVVDAFGRWLDLPADRLAALDVATTNTHPAGPPSLTLPPRFQRPARLALRFVGAAVPDGAPDVDARVDQQHPDQRVSPLCGWLLPDHVDASLEFFDASGAALGQLREDDITGAVVWEGAPGRPGPIGAPPDPGPDPAARFLTRLATGAVAADAAARNDPAGPPAESALSALLRAIDTTLWTVDPLGSVGTGAVAGLVGRPIAVIRGALRLEVASDLDQLSYASPADQQPRAQAYLDLAARAISARLGELTRTDDGLLGYAVDDNYLTLSPVAPEVLTQARASGPLAGQLSAYGRGSQDPPEIIPITHPYLNGPPSVTVRPGQTVHLTLLLNPGGKIHVTSGVVPRKALALAHDWFHDGLTALSPSFRFGPVLVDPTTVRMPKVTGLDPSQEFTRRDTPITWRNDPITAATQTAFLPELPTTLQEGWIRVTQALSAGETPQPSGGTGGTTGTGTTGTSGTGTGVTGGQGAP